MVREVGHYPKVHLLVESFVVWVEHEAAAGRRSPGGTVPAVADGRGQDEPGLLRNGASLDSLSGWVTDG
jgi:hypothetical protein